MVGFVCNTLSSWVFRTLTISSSERWWRTHTRDNCDILFPWKFVTFPDPRFWANPSACWNTFRWNESLIALSKEENRAVELKSETKGLRKRRTFSISSMIIISISGHISLRRWSRGLWEGSIVENMEKRRKDSNYGFYASMDIQYFSPIQLTSRISET